MAGPHLSLTPEIEGLRRQFDALSADADALVTPLTDEEFLRPPPQGGWSVALCLDHLNTAARAYLPRLDEAIADAIRRGLYGDGPYSYGWFARFFIRSMEPPPRFRTKAPAVFQPPPARTRHEIVAAFRAYQVQYIDRLRQANGLDLQRAKVISPVSKWMRLPMGAAFAAITAHERRH
ncbi:MAG: DinB family protein, partial [Vicinamibacterales bacterium]